MKVERIFLGWDRPLCDTVPAWLLQEAAGPVVDLRGTLVGVPTRQAAWRLRNALPLAARNISGSSLLGPEIVAASVLIAPPVQPGLASGLQMLLAWSRVLRETPSEDVKAFLRGQSPDSATVALQIARRLISLRRELADGGLGIADVAARGIEIEEHERWAAMALLEQNYLALLADWGLQDVVTAQRDHAAAARPDPAVERLVLAAVPDPPALLLQLLSGWAAAGGKVTVLIAAPESEADAFDAWGRPLPEVWEKRQIDLADNDILLAANPDDQAARIASLLEAAGYQAEAQSRTDSATPSAPAVAVGVPDRETVVPLQRELTALGLPPFDPQNLPLSDTPLFRLIQALLSWFEGYGYAETAALLRHPDVLVTFDGLSADPKTVAKSDQPDRGGKFVSTLVLQGLDRVQAKHLPVTFGDLQRATASFMSDPSASQSKSARSAALHLQQALNRLEEWRGSVRTLPLSAALRSILQDIYQQRQLQARAADDGLFERAGLVLEEALSELATAESLGQTTDEAAAALLARLQEASVKTERAGELLDLEGWLELGWNPAPVLLVAGLNEGFVPDGHLGDAFLPDTLRSQLELRDDRLRAARDAYMLTALQAQRVAAGRLILLVGKRSTAGDPLRPSRLFFRCPDQTLLSRAQLLFQDPPPSRMAAAHSVGFQLDPSLVPPEELKHRLPGRVSPTALKDYLACPLRFYLRHILGMRSADDLAREPDALAFGNICHAVLEAMAADQGRIWACGDVPRLAHWLGQRVDQEIAALYGPRRWLGVDLVAETIRRRLAAFAEQQVAWHEAGWEIIESEVPFTQLEIAGSELAGRIDRIDRHRDGRYCVLDYKTSDKAEQPQETHLQTGAAPFDEAWVEGELSKSGKPKAARRWVDLQLPLYREMLLRSRGWEDVAVGYVALPKALSDTGFLIWEDYQSGLHKLALECAAECIRRIHQGIFWPPTAKPAYDDFAELFLGGPEKTMLPPPD